MAIRKNRRVAVALVALCVVGAWAVWPQAQQLTGSIVAIDVDDIGGSVSGPNGPEAGVWVIAETTDLPTKYAKIVVTDDQGRYVLPDLPKASYKVWVRGYGLVDSAPVQGVPGKTLNLTAVGAPNARAAAQIYPANYWYSMLHVPPPSNFPGTGPKGNGIPVNFKTQEEWVVRAKDCLTCHQIGDKATREIPKNLGTFESAEDAWSRRVQSGQPGARMIGDINRLGEKHALGMLGDWSDRVVAGEVPAAVPPRPRGVERNLVLTMWDWGGARGIDMIHDEISSDKRNPTVNADGPVYGTGDSSNTLVWIDPQKNVANEVKIPVLDPTPWPAWLGNLGAAAQVLLPSPYWGEEIIWRNNVAPHNPMVDSKGRVWMSANIRNPQNQPGYCSGSTNRFAAYFPLPRGGGYQLAVYDPKTKQFTLVDKCAGGAHLEFVDDKDESIFAGNSNVFSWVSGRILDETHSAESAEGWCPAVLDTNGDGKITLGWTEPNQPVDPMKDHRVNFGCYGNAINPADGSAWCAPAGFPGTITRLERGANPPESCRAEQYEVPPGKALYPRGMDFDRDGVAWISFAGSGHMASFDRRKCKVLNGPTATGQHCAEGWTFYEAPGPKLAGTKLGTDWFYIAWVDQFDTLGLGRNVPFTQGSNSDALYAVMPGTGEFVTLRVPYPLGFYARGQDGRIDNPNAGWKGRGVWSSFAPVPNWHMEGGKGTRAKAVKFQLRPNPLSK